MKGIWQGEGVGYDALLSEDINMHVEKLSKAIEGLQIQRNQQLQENASAYTHFPIGSWVMHQTAKGTPGKGKPFIGPFRVESEPDDRKELLISEWSRPGRKKTISVK